MPRYVQFVFYGLFPLIIADWIWKNVSPLAALFAAYFLGGLVAWALTVEKHRDEG